MFTLDSFDFLFYVSFQIVDGDELNRNVSDYHMNFLYWLIH